MSRLLLILPFLLFFIACDSGQTDSNSKKVGMQATPEKSFTTPDGKKVEVQTNAITSDLADDESVDYSQFSEDICACATKSDELSKKMFELASNKKTKEFTELTPMLNEQFEKTVKCSQDVAKDLDSQFSLKKLVPEMKKKCGSMSDELVWQILQGLGLK